MEEELVKTEDLRLSRVERVLFYFSITISGLILLSLLLNNGFSPPGGYIYILTRVCKMVSFYSLLLSLLFIFSGTGFLLNGSGKGYYLLLPGAVVFTNAVILESFYTFLTINHSLIPAAGLFVIMLFILVAGFFGFIAVWLLKLRIRFMVSNNRFIMIICFSIFWLFTQIAAMIIPRMVAWDLFETY